MRFTVKNREISPENGILLFLIGDNADYKAQFEFDSEWNGVVKTARFVRGKKFQEVVLVNDECEIPIEVLKQGFLEVGVFSAEMTTTPCRILVKGSIKELGGMTAEPTPDVYRQIIKMIEDLEVVGVTDEAKSKERLEIPYKAEGRTVLVLSAGAFSECKKLKEITVYENITLMENGLFKGADNLTTVHMKRENAEELEAGADLFVGASKDITLYFYTETSFQNFVSGYWWSIHAEHMKKVSG